MDDLDVSTPSSDSSTEISDNTESTETKQDDSSGIVDPLDKAPKEEPKPDPLRATKHKIKANGKELELDYDTLLKKAELAEGSYERFENATKKEKEAEAIKKKILSGDIDELLDVIPLDRLLEITSQIEKTRLQLEGLSQEEIDAMLYRQEAEAAKAQLKKLEDDRIASEREAQSMQAFKIIESEILDVLDEAKKSGVPLADLPDVGVEVIDELLAVLTMVEEEERAGRRYSGKIPTAKDAFQKIQSRYQTRLDTYLQKHSPDKLLAMLTPEQQKALRQASLDNLYGNNPRPGIPERSESVQVQASPGPKRMTTDQYFKQKELSFRS